MKKRKRACLAVSRIILLLIGLIFVPAISQAKLTLESVNPNLGELGQNLEVTLTGSEFDASTRVAMFLDAANERAVLGAVQTPGLAYGIAVADDLAYVADWHKGLQIIDISNPANPMIVGSVVTPGFSAEDVAVAGTIAYVADGDSGLQIIDISNPANPVIIGSVNTPGHAMGVAVSGSKAYVADGDSGLQIIDIVIPTSPQISGSVDTPDYANDVTVAGIMAYLADGLSGLQIINISDPKNPWIAGSADTPGDAQDVSIEDYHAFVADSYGGLQVIDISNPTSPWIAGSADTPGYADGVVVEAKRAYVANSDKGLQVIDISNPTSLQIIGSVDLPYDAGVVALSGNIALVAGWDSDVFAINISNITSPQIHGSVDTPDDARGIDLAGNRAYLANWNSGLQIIDISNPQNPLIIGTADTPGFAWDVTVAGDRAYVADWHKGLQIINISVSTSPQLDGSVDTPGYAQGIVVSGTKAYVADGEFGLEIIDVSDPKNPGIVGSVDTPDDAQAVTVANTKAYVADGGSGLQIIDISNPTSPWIVGSVDTPGDAQDIAVLGEMAYVADGYHSFQVVDVSNPTSPRIVSSVNTSGYAWGVTVAGNRAYVADGSGGNLVIDISNPTRPQIIGAVDTPGHAIETRVLGNKVYIADDFYGLVIVPLPVEIESFIVVSDNMISCSLISPATAGNYTLRVFDESDSEKLIGAVTFSASDDYQQLAQKKAIIVAGYRSYPNDSLWDKTKRCANMAYLSLLTQGYKSENIFYLSPEPVDLDGDGQNDVDAAANLQNLSYAIRTWAPGTPELLLYITDHGGSGTFQLNESQILDATTLDGWLDEAQSAISDRAIFVYDACKSGSFLNLLKPPSGKDRIMIASTSADEYAWFEQDGILSFSFQFWAYVMVDGYLSRAFNAAAKMMETDQSALLDANGNGVPNEKADDISDIVIGRGRTAAATPPFVGHVSGKIILAGETSTSFWANNVGGLNPVVQVWAVIIPPGDRPADDPIIDFPKVDLLDADQDGTYEASYTGFTSVGTYRLMVYAKDEDGVISIPKEIAISQTDSDSYEDDDTFNKANAIVLNDPNSQLHNIHDAGDEDWIKFYGLAGETYSIDAYNLGDNCDAVIELYASDGVTLLDSQDTIGDPNADELLEWLCNQDDIYYVKIKHYESAVFGDGTEYDLKVYRSIAALTGFVTGKVTDGVSGQAIADVKIHTEQGASALSITDGSYVMVHPPGTTTVSAQVAGYNAKSYSGIQVVEGDITTRNIVLVPSSADTDNDGILDSVEYASPCLDPNDPDTDNDGLVDGEEDINCDGIFDPGESNPCDPDTDDDQMPDGWEVDYNLNPLVDDASEDADGDGYTNLEEYMEGSDPRDENSLPIPKAMPWIPLLLLDNE